MLCFRIMKEKADLIAISFNNDKVKNSKRYYIKKNRYGKYSCIVDFNEYKKLLSQSDYPIVFDIDEIEDDLYLDTIQKEIARIERDEILSKFSNEDLLVELSKRTNCFVSNNIIKLSLQKGLNNMMSYNDTININHDIYTPLSDKEIQDVRNAHGIDIRTLRRLIATVVALKKKQI